jgi:type VI secretion system secreted protein VgrG
MSETMESAPRQAGDLTQDNRLLAIETPLGKDHLLLTSISGDEHISRLFAYQVDMLSLDRSIKPESLIGRKVKIIVREGRDNSRPIHGMVAQFHAGPITFRDCRRYTAKVVPWPWFLTHSSDCRIFQHLSIPEIIEQVFGLFGFADYQVSVSRSDYPKQEFCVQYRETAFNFVSRLMEQAGLFYYFRHDDDRHVMVIADKNVSFHDLSVPVLVYTSSNDPKGQVVSWQHSYTFRPGRWAQTDFDFEVPTKSLLTSETTVLKLANADRFERFDYPGLYVDKGKGADSTRTRMEAEEAAYHIVEGRGHSIRLAVGAKFKLQDHPCQDPKEPYVISHVHHEASDPTYFGNSSEVPSYSNSFEAIPYDVRFRPQRVTTKPVVHGPQTATVVGPPGEKIFTDKHGRVRVQFHWDRYGKRDDKSSCWIRVSYAWAGRGWGNFNLPHVGHEVVVSFLEGDPDQPMVIGRVYNGDNGIAMGMPANKTQSAIRDHAGNEILMEGKGGSEDIRITAVKDMNVTVTNDYNDIVKSGNRTIAINSGTHTETIKGDTQITVTTGALTVSVSNNTATFISKSTMNVDSSDADVHIVAKTKIALDVGSSHLLMEENGSISLIGKNIAIHGSESVSISSAAIRSIADQEHEIKGAITVSEGVTTNTVKGGMVMLNPGT